MPLIKSHTDEAREKNIKEMIAAGHDPKQAVAAGYANQRKYKKMAEGGMVAHNDPSEQDKIIGETSDPHDGLYDMMDDSHREQQLDEVPEKSGSLAEALHGRDNPSNGHVDSDIDEEETVNMPESHFAEMAKMAILKKKKKPIDASEA
jgi:hypothetical protein